MHLLKLYNFAEENNIDVHSFDLVHFASLVLQQNDGYSIAINPMKLKTTAEERVCLAHELGHCATGSFYNRNTPFDVRGKHEAIANRWAIKYTIPRRQLAEALKHGCIEIWDLAEHFGVTEPFMLEAIKYYKLCG